MRSLCGYALSFTLVGFAAVASVPRDAHVTHPPLAAMFEQVVPSVVNIGVTGALRTPADNPLMQDPVMRFLLEDFAASLPAGDTLAQSSGSGVIVDAAHGYLLTNLRMLDHADAITVTLADQRQFAATLLGSDATTGIALLQIDAPNLVAAPFGDSATLQAGDLLLAIGNPLGLGRTVAAGALTAHAGVFDDPTGSTDLLQTDARLNYANLGGALLDANGRLVGINSVDPAGGPGFAVSSATLRVVLDSILGRVRASE